MSYSLTIKGTETLTYKGEIISSAYTTIDTPPSSGARSTNVIITLYITGKLLADSGNSPTSKLFEWSKVPATSPDCYRDVTVRVLSDATIVDGQPYRVINVPNAFVVNYSEKYSEKIGFAEFALTLRQKADKVNDVNLCDCC